jgi:hypothetical protein
MSVASFSRSSSDYHIAAQLGTHDIGYQVNQCLSSTTNVHDDAVGHELDSKSADSKPDPLTDTVYDALAAAVLNPQFREAVNNLVTSDLPNHAIALSSYPVQSSADVQQGIFGPIIDILGGLVFSSIQANAIQASSTGPLPAHVQQGVFNILTSVLKNPIFTKVVKGIAVDVVKALVPASSS